MKQTRNWATMAWFCLFTFIFAVAANAAVESYVVVIDNQTTQPVGTGLIPADASRNILVLAEGAVQPFPSSSRYDNGWIGPDGQSKLSRVGQHVGDGMPYGALIGNFNTNLPTYQFMGTKGAFGIPGSGIGVELRVALNMSDSDLSSMDGQIVATFVEVPNGDADVVNLELDASSAYPLPTGIIANAGDRFVVLAHGAAQQPSTAINPLSLSWFDPAGMPKFNRTGQPLSEGPYGGLYGTFGIPEGGFYVGDAGSFTAQTNDDGDELDLFLNMSSADQALVNGKFKVNIIRASTSTSSAPDRIEQNGNAASSFPNPTMGESRIRYSLPREDQVLLRVYNAQGRWVRTLVDGRVSAGANEVSWDGRSDDGEPVASGTYFFQLSTSAGSETGRIVMTR